MFYRTRPSSRTAAKSIYKFVILSSSNLFANLRDRSTLMNISAAKKCTAKTKAQFAITLVALFVVVGVAAGTGLWRSRAANRALTSAASTLAASALHAMPQTQLPLEVEVITVRPTGFEPTQIVRPPGPYILLIENRSGVDTINLRMTLAGVPPAPPVTVFQVQLPRGQLDWTTLMVGNAGQYTLAEDSHPSWNCTVRNGQ